MDAAQVEALRTHRWVAVAVIGSAVTVAACALVAVAYLLGWVGTRPAATVATATPSAANARANLDAKGPVLVPGEEVVDAPERPTILFPKYSAPTPPAPAPPPSAVDPPSGVPRSPYLPAPAPRPGAPATPGPGAAPPVASIPPQPPLPLRDVPPRPHEERYASESRGEERGMERRGRRFCDNCAVVTGVSQYLDEWEVHLRFSDGTRRRIHYDRPPPVARGDRVFFENGRLYLEN